MYYTHYFSRIKSLPMKQFKLAVRDINKIREKNLNLILSINLDDFRFSNTGMKFNGSFGNECEPFHFPQKLKPNKYWHVEDLQRRFSDRCKTDKLPYDTLVIVCLIVLLKYFNSSQLIVSSDGDLNDWAEGIEICQNTLGYGNKLKQNDEELFYFPQKEYCKFNEPYTQELIEGFIKRNFAEE